MSEIMERSIIYKLNPDIPSLSKQQASKLFSSIEVEDTDTCTWIPECHEQAVRLAIYDFDRELYTVKFLCERHRRMGIWDE